MKRLERRKSFCPEGREGGRSETEVEKVAEKIA